MVSLRKLFLVPAALVLVAGVASAATTVINCAAPAPSTGVLRSEGRTELLPTLTFSCTNSVAQEAGTTVPFTVSVYPTGTATFTSPATGDNAPAITLGAAPEVNALSAAPSVSASAITFTKVNLPIDGAAFTLNIKNLYVDASMIPAGGSIGLSIIAISNDSATADSAIFGTPASPILSVANLAITLKSLTVTDTLGADNADKASLSACGADKDFDVSKTVGDQGITAIDLIKFKPVITSAFTPNGRVQFTVTNVPAGVKLYVPLYVASGTVIADLMAGYDPTTLAGGYQASVTAGDGVIYSLVPAGGTVVYQIGVVGNGTDSLDVPLYATAATPVLAASPVSLSAGYAPVGGTSIPRFVAGTTIASDFFNVAPCTSSLFFNYVIAQGGYDTGLAVSSSGDFGDASKASSGQCVFSFYGTGAPTDTKTLDVVVGTTNAFDIKGAMPDANFYGYAVAKCNFRNATGYAFVANSSGATASYLPMTRP